LLDVVRRRPLLDALTVRRGKNKGKPLAKVRDAVRTGLERLGWERALIYKTMVLTGLRKKQLRSITVGQPDLDGPVAYLVLEAADDWRASPLAPMLAPTADKSGTSSSIGGRRSSETKNRDEEPPNDVSASLVKQKHPSTNQAHGCREGWTRGFEPPTSRTTIWRPANLRPLPIVVTR